MGYGEAFFDSSDYKVVSGNIVYALDLNNPFQSIESGLDSLVAGVRGASGFYSATDLGTPNAYVMNPDPAIENYYEGLMVWLKPLNTNTGASTLKLNDLAAVPIKQTGLVDLLPGDLLVNYWVQLKYSSGVFQIVSQTKRAEVEDTVSVVGSAPIEVSATTDTITVAIDQAQIAGRVEWEVDGNSAISAASGSGYAVDTSLNTVTVTFPASPSEGDLIGVADQTENFSTNNCTINPNGNRIAGSTSNQTLGKDGQAIVWMYTDSTYGWIEVSKKVGDGLPVGSVIGWDTEVVPDGWFERDGTELATADFPELYAVLGGRYGMTDGAGGAGTTHFRLKDARGRFERVWDHGAGNDPDAASRTDRGDGTTGDNVGTEQDYEVEAHGHVLQHCGSVGVGADVASGGGTSTNYTGGSYGGNETRPINTNKMSIIKWRA